MTTSNVITASQAKEISKTAKYDKEADILLTPIYSEIKSAALDGKTQITIADSMWYKPAFNKYHRAILKLKNNGYNVNFEEKEQSNPYGAGPPITVRGLVISW